MYSDALVVLGTAGVVVPLARHFGLNPILGYLGAGLVLGPNGLGSFIQEAPLLYWVTVVDADNIKGIADLGVVFLLFLIGLELSLDRLISMRRLVFGLGGAQLILTSLILALIFYTTGQPAPTAIILGLCLALSSTAIVLELLSTQNKLTTVTGRASFSILLAQDLAVIPILMFVSILGSHTGGSFTDNAARAMASALIAIIIIVVSGRLILRPLFRIVGSAKSTELLIASALFVIISASMIASLAGLSMALGAFISGLLLAETEYRKAVESIIEPFKGLLLGVFFFTVGMNFDFRDLIKEPIAILALLSGLIALKAAIIIVLIRLFNLSWPAAIETGIILGPAGEFSLVTLNMSMADDLLSKDITSFASAAASLSMVISPLLSSIANYINKITSLNSRTSSRSKYPHPTQRHHVIVIGYGRVGKVVASFLMQHNIQFISTDNDPDLVSLDHENGHEVFYGDARQAAFLEACGIYQAEEIIITVSSRSIVDAMVHRIREMRSDIPIISRARDTDHAQHLYEIGVTEAVPETVEASLQISESGLVRLGLDPEIVSQSIHFKRTVFRDELIAASRFHLQSSKIKFERSNPQKAIWIPNISIFTHMKSLLKWISNFSKVSS